MKLGIPDEGNRSQHRGPPRRLRRRRPHLGLREEGFFFGLEVMCDEEFEEIGFWFGKSFSLCEFVVYIV